MAEVAIIGILSIERRDDTSMYDILIKNGKIVDGTGIPAYHADVAIVVEKIVAVGSLSDQDAKKTIDAEGLVVCPGFIDDHSHGDLNVLADPYARNQLLQGITTEVGGSCGLSFAPIKKEADRMVSSQIGFASDEKKAELLRPMTFPEYMDLVDNTAIAVNLASYIGQGIVRSAVMGYAEGDANEAQLTEMKDIVREGMEAGAFGLSTGLIYPTGSLTSTEEIIELCKVVAEYDGLYSTHMRGESDTIISSVEEAIRTAEESGAHLVISHHKIAGVANHGKSTQTLAMVDDAIARGVKVHLDVYPYIAGATTLAAAIPRQFLADKTEFVKKAADPELRRQIIDVIENGVVAGENMVKSCGGLHGIVIASADECPQYIGRSLTEIAAEEGKEPYDVLFDLLIATDANAMAVFFTNSEDDMIRIMQYPRTMFGTDGSHSSYVNFFRHPRAFGSFPHILTEYVRDHKVLTLEEMVRKACALPAEVLQLKEKGLIKEGYDADVLVLDLENMKVHSSFANANGGNEGFKYVLVNGQVAVENDACTDVLSGKLLRSHSYKS